MIPTFSLNHDWLTDKRKVKKIINLTIDMKTNYTDKKGHCYSAMAEGIINGNIGEARLNPDAFASAYDRNKELQDLKRAEKEISIVTEDEYRNGAYGIPDSKVKVVTMETELNDIMGDMDLETDVVDFLKLRTKIIFEEHQDIWRLIELCKEGDSAARLRFLAVRKKYEGLDDCLKDIIGHSATFKKLEEILC